MAQQNKTRKLKLNVALRGYPEGIVIPVKCDGAGVPLDQYWRRRVNDAKIDKCVQFVITKKKSTK